VPARDFFHMNNGPFQLIADNGSYILRRTHPLTGMTEDVLEITGAVVNTGSLLANVEAIANDAFQLGREESSPQQYFSSALLNFNPNTVN